MTKRKTAPLVETAGPAPAVASPPAAALTVDAPELESTVESFGTPGLDAEQLQEPQAEPTYAYAVVVRSVAARGRWRIGRFFTQETTEIPADTLTMDQIAALAADPELICATSD